MNNTQYFKFNLDTEVSVKDILDAVYDAMAEKGYNPVNRLWGILCPEILRTLPAIRMHAV